MKFYQLFLLIFFLFLYRAPGHAQLAEVSRNFTQADGLPSNEVYYVFEDSRHFLWMATDQGVVRYNGKKMEFVSLPDNVVFKIKEDEAGRIWFFSSTGKLAYFENEKVVPFKFNEKITKEILRISIRDAFVTASGQIEINSVYDNNYSILPTGSIKAHRYYQENSTNHTLFLIDSFPGKRQIARLVNLNLLRHDSIHVTVKKENKQLLYTIENSFSKGSYYGSVLKEDGATIFFAGKVLSVLYPDGHSIQAKFEHEILCIKPTDGVVWVGFLNGGAVKVDSKLKAVDGLPFFDGMSVTSIEKDFEGNMWLSTLEKGVYFILQSNIRRFASTTVFHHPIFRMFPVDDSTLLYSSGNNLYELSGNVSKQIDWDEYLYVSDLFIKDRNIFWSGKRGAHSTDSRIAFMKHLPFPPYNKIYHILSGSEMAALPNGKFLFNTVTSINLFDSSQVESLNAAYYPLYFNFVQSRLFSDESKQVWLGNIKGLFRLDTTTKSAVPYHLNNNDVLKNGVNAIRQMNNGMYAVAIRFGGLILFKDKNVVAHITEKDGLLRNSISYILVNKNQLWLATTKGMSVIQFEGKDYSKYRIVNAGRSEGLSNVQLNQLLFHNNQLLLAGNTGLYVLHDPSAWLNKKPWRLPFYISSLSYGNKDTIINSSNSFTVPFGDKRIVIKYTAVSFNAAEELKYYYKISEVDTLWHETNSDQIVLENLSPGNYNVEVKAAIPSLHRESVIHTIGIRIEKPWWLANWFLVTAFIMVALLIFVFYHYRINLVRKKEQQKSAIKSKLAELEQTALRSQMNPHFVFNCLTSIQQLIVENHNLEANEYLVKFARLIRRTLELSAQSYVSIYQETDYIKEYIELEKMRYPGLFDFNVLVAQDIDVKSTLIPNMMLQPVVENAIRHGVKSLSNRKGSIELSIYKRDNQVCCEVSDNGVGRRQITEPKEQPFSRHKSFGIDIVEKRIKILNDGSVSKAFIEIKDLFDEEGVASGTVVTLVFPIKIS